MALDAQMLGSTLRRFLEPERYSWRAWQQLRREPRCSLARRPLADLESRCHHSKARDLSKEPNTEGHKAAERPRSLSRVYPIVRRPTEVRSEERRVGKECRARR